MMEFFKQLIKDKHKIFALEQFLKITSVNVSGVTLWHGVNDILNMKISNSIQDNFTERQLKYLKKWGFKIE